MSLSFLSFGNERFVKSRERIKNEASAILNRKGLPFFNSVIVETEDIENDEEYKAIIDKIPKTLGNGRGFWWYTWKPYVIYKTLKTLKDGDFLFYCDAGMTLMNNNVVKRRLEGLIRTVSNPEVCPTGWVTFITTGPPHERQEYMFNTNQIFEHFNVIDNEDITHTQQCQAGVHMIKKSEKTMEISELWYKTAVEKPNLFVADPRVFKDMESSGMEGFRQHRHDQSVWSIIVKLHNVTIFNHNRNPCRQSHHRC
jgi:hypothetical protein